MLRLLIVPLKVHVKVILVGLLAAALIVSPRLFPLPLLGALVAESVLFTFAVLLLWCFWPRLRWGLEPNLVGEAASHPSSRVRLSFDDGPTPGLTDEILNRLRERNQRATFFVLVHKARRSPELVRRMVAEGHEIGLHGEDHRLPFFERPSRLRERLLKARQDLERIIGRSVRLYRPSHGCKNLALVQALRGTGLQFCFWDFGVWDTDAPSEAVLCWRFEIVLRCVSGAVTRKPVVLLHDGLGDELSPPRHGRALLGALARLLEGAVGT